MPLFGFVSLHLAGFFFQRVHGRYGLSPFTTQTFEPRDPYPDRRITFPVKKGAPAFPQLLRAARTLFTLG